MSGPLHTPYDGSHKAFQIGLKPLDVANWLDVDGELDAYLDEKQRLGAQRFDDVFAAEAGTESAQAELLAIVAAHLPHHFAGRYQRSGDAIIVGNRRIELDSTAPPLWTAARLVQEDLVLMRKGETGWRLAAAALCFPSSWRLADKFGRPMHEVHGPVPGFGAGTRPAELIARMFDNLRPEQPMIRWNWSLFGDEKLYHPESSHPRGRFGDGPRADRVVFRVERQTLRKLPVSGDIVFTIRIYLDPIARLEAHPGGAVVAAALIAQLHELSPEQADYKGLSHERDRLIDRLAEIASVRAG